VVKDNNGDLAGELAWSTPLIGLAARNGEQGGFSARLRDKRAVYEKDKNENAKTKNKVSRYTRTSFMD